MIALQGRSLGQLFSSLEKPKQNETSRSTDLSARWLKYVFTTTWLRKDKQKATKGVIAVDSWMTIWLVEARRIYYRTRRIWYNVAEVPLRCSAVWWYSFDGLVGRNRCNYARCAHEYRSWDIPSRVLRSYSFLMKNVLRTPRRFSLGPVVTFDSGEENHWYHRHPPRHRRRSLPWMTPV